MAEWHVRQDGGRPIGPVSTELVIRGIEAGKVALTAEVCKVGTRDWMPIDMVDEFSHVAYDEDAATRVTESPWFVEQHSSQPRIAPPPPPTRPKQISSLGLPAPPPPPPPAPSGPRTAVLQPRSMPLAAPPPPKALPVPSRGPAARPYEVDENARTRVATDAAAGVSTYEFDDETMTRVAAPRAPAALLGAPPKNRGLLKTAPMWNTGGSPIEPVRPAAGEPARVTMPRPAAGTRPEAAIQVREDLMTSAPNFPPAPPGFGAGPAQGAMPKAQGYQPPPFQPTLPAGMAPPQPNHGPAPPAHYQPAPVERRGDGGVKALIALIVLLFMALMVVLILLVLRR
jgi:hypothetical protein